MFNVQTKLSVAFATILFMLASSCSSEGGVERKTDEQKASEIVAQIDDMVKVGAYRKAIELIDSLNATYPEEIALRKTTLLSRARAMEGLIRDSIPIADEEMARTKIQIDSLARFFVPVSEKGLPTYMVDKSVRGISLLSGNAVQPRTGDAGSPWVLMLSTSGTGSIRAIAGEIDGRQFSIEIANADSRMVRASTGAEMITLNAVEANPLAELLGGNNRVPVKLEVVGTKKNATITLTPAVQTAIYRTYLYANALEQNRRARVTRELLERKLIVAQNQIANFAGS